MMSAREYYTKNGAQSHGETLKATGQIASFYVSGPKTGRGGELIYNLHVTSRAGLERCILAA